MGSAFNPSSSDAQAATAVAAGESPLEFDLLVRRCMGRIELVDRLLASFEDRFPKELSQIEQCLEAGDDERLTRLAHQLKGTTANVSANALLAVASQMEESARAHERSDVAACLTAIRHEWKRFQEYRASLPRAAAKPVAAVQPTVARRN